MFKKEKLNYGSKTKQIIIANVTDDIENLEMIYLCDIILYESNIRSI